MSVIPSNPEPNNEEIKIFLIFLAFGVLVVMPALLIYLKSIMR